MNKPAARRLGDRVPTNMRVEIIDADGYVTVAKMIDLSISGARMETEWGATIPQTFVLRFGRDKQERRVELVWRKGYDFAVRFVDDVGEVVKPAPKAAPAAPKISVADLRKMVIK